MPSLPTHLLVGAALGQCAEGSARRNWRFWCLALFCSALPDIDVIGFHFGVHYADFWGHRGFTHSILFAAAAGILAGTALGGRAVDRIRNSALLLVIAASHAVLDAMTDGGLGVAFFSPFDNSRYFFPWRPIEVSPIGVGRFLSEQGWHVLLNEMLLVWAPALLVGAALYGIGRLRKRNQPHKLNK
jgi:inner membrane protein